ncbi:MAG: hypothetical protein AAGE59_11965 [Cyanobacteria bacterium P01_F01_bin.86]
MISEQGFGAAMALLHGHYGRTATPPLLKAYWKILSAQRGMDDEWLERGVLAAIATEPFFPPLGKLYELGKPKDHRPEHKVYAWLLPEPRGLSAEQRQGLASVADVVAELKRQRHEVLATGCLADVPQVVVPMNAEVAELFELFQQAHPSSEPEDAA